MNRFSIKDILNNKPLNSECIEVFFKIVREQTVFSPQDPSLWESPDQIVAVNGEFIQILISNQRKSAAFDHFITVYFDKSYFHVYDSLNLKQISANAFIYLDCLVPNFDSTKLLFHTMETKSEEKDSGIFACAYFTSLLIGLDPTEEPYISTLMRKWLNDVIKHSVIFPFPTETKKVSFSSYLKKKLNPESVVIEITDQNCSQVVEKDISKIILNNEMLQDDIVDRFTKLIADKLKIRIYTTFLWQTPDRIQEVNHYNKEKGFVNGARKAR